MCTIAGQLAPVRFENFVHRRGVADVDFVMLIGRHVRQQLIARLPRRRFLAEKSLPHVVVDPDDAQPSPAKRLTVSEPINPAEPVTRMVRAL